MNAFYLLYSLYSNSMVFVRYRESSTTPLVANKLSKPGFLQDKACKPTLFDISSIVSNNMVDTLILF